jgi:hypothetical protein
MKNLLMLSGLTFVTFFTGLVHASDLAYKILLKEEHTERAALKLEELDWMVGHWQYSAFFFGSEIEGLTIVSAAQHNLMLGHAHAWSDEHTAVAEILSYTQRGQHIDFRVRHVTYDLHSIEPVEEPKVHPLIRHDANVFYFDGHTIVKNNDDQYTLYLEVKGEDGQPHRFVIPHKRLSK